VLHYISPITIIPKSFRVVATLFSFSYFSNIYHRTKLQNPELYSASFASILQVRTVLLLEERIRSSKMSYLR